MTPLSIIVARSANHVIGAQNTIPWDVPEDMLFFREQTLGLPVIMGKNTWLSLKGPLPGRTNIVISKDLVKHPAVTTFHSLVDAQAYLTLSQFEAGWVIGGAQLYAEAMGIAAEVLVTTFDFHVNGDTRFSPPALEDARSWHRLERKHLRSERSTSHPGCVMTFERYIRVGI